MEYPILFSPFSIRGLSLRNRIVRAATYEKRADADGFVTGEILDLYRALARGGAGLIITGGALVHYRGRAFPRMLCVHSDNYIEGLRRLSDAVHAEDGKICLQIMHGGAQCRPELLRGLPALAPSEVYEPSLGIAPKAMTDEEIWEAIESFGDATRRAEESGFDALEIHGAHGFLISSFISPFTNKRDDYWGGDAERRFHFLEEVFKSVKASAPPDFPVILKINADDMLEGGITARESLVYAERLEAMGLSAVEISGGMRQSKVKTARPDISRVEDEAYFRPYGRMFKERLKIPVIVTGGMRSGAVMEQVLERGEADFIGIGRPLIREPDLPLKLKGGKEKADCISCNGCLNIDTLKRVACVQAERRVGAD